LAGISAIQRPTKTSELLKDSQNNEELLKTISEEAGHELFKHLDLECLSKLKIINENFQSKPIVLLRDIPFRGTQHLELAMIMILGLSKILNLKVTDFKQLHGNQCQSLQVCSSAETDVQAAYFLDTSAHETKVILLPTKKLKESMPVSMRNNMEAIGMQDFYEFTTNAGTKRTSLFYFQRDKSIATRLNGAAVRGTTAEAQEFLLQLQEFLAKNSNNGISIKEGDLVVWSNRTVLNGLMMTSNDSNQLFLRVLLSNK